MLHEPTSYLNRLRLMRDELAAHPEIEITEEVVEPPATAEQIAAAERKLVLPAAMRAFYGECNGFKLRWTFTGDGGDAQDFLTGSIDLRPVETVLGEWKDRIWFDEEWDNKRFKPLHPVDYFVPEACAALYLDGSPNPTVYYHYCGEEMSSMEVDFAGYLDKLVDSRGLLYWQTAVVADITGEDQTLNPSIVRTWLPRLFATFDPAKFFRRDRSSADADEAAELAALAERVAAAFDRHGVAHGPFAMAGSAAFRLEPDAANLARAERALAEVDHAASLAGDWGAKQIGSVWIEKNRPS